MFVLLKLQGKGKMIKSVKGFEGLYEISDSGKVVSLDRYNVDKNGKKKFYPGKQLKAYKDVRNHTSYLHFTLSKDGRTKKIGLHRLLAENFIPNPENKPHINHIDNNGLNNSLSNIEWVTHSENMLHSQKQGRLHKAQSKGGKTLGATEESKKQTFKKYESYVGTELNSLKILGVHYKKISSIYFNCECLCCGKTVDVYAANAVSGLTEKCGTCKRHENTIIKTEESIGKRFGSLTVLSYVGRRASDFATLVSVVCDCGRVYQTAHKNLVNGTAQRCQPCSRAYNTKIKNTPNKI